MSNLRVANDGDTLAADFAEHLIERIAGKKGDTFYLALSGGSTPKKLFGLLASAAYRDRVDWSKVQWFWGDERLVPHTDPESNYGVTKELLFDKLEVPADNIHAVRTNLAPDAAAEDYAAVIRRIVPANTDEPPVFDLIMLGMGDDGHTASIFPDSLNLLTHEDITAVAKHPDSGQLRVTFTGALINAAAEIAFLVGGAAKADRLSMIHNQQPGYLKYPAAHIRPTEGELYWFMDEAAARQIQVG